MLSLRHFIFAVLSPLLVIGTVTAQDRANATQAPSSAIVTATASTDRVRIASSNSIVQMQVEVYASGGEKLFDRAIRGNVFDWHLQDGQAQRLSAGEYVCVVTVKNIAGRLTQKLGAVRVGEKDVSVGPAETVQLSPQQSQAIGPIEDNSSWTILDSKDNQTTTVIAHDGTDGQIVRGRGALSFRLGDFFSGNDKEQMRLTEEGNLGLGTAKPTARLDVAGTIRTAKGIEFSDGTVQTTGLSGRKDKNGNVVPAATGTGTMNQIAKWTDNSGTLGDSIITEANGFIGIGNTNPTAKLSVSASSGAELRFDQGAQGITPVLSVISLPASTSQGAASILGAGTGGSSFVFSDNLPFFLVKDTKANVVNNQLGNGTILFTILPTGNVGIGTTTPAAKLDVTGAINTSTQYNLGGNRILSGAGTNNFFVGFGAGAVNTGSDNAFFGFNAGNVNASGSGNSFFGSKSGLANTSGIDNSFFGTLAGSKNTTAPDNSFFGFIAGRDNTSGAANSFFGSGTGQNNTTGSTNSFFGRSAGERNTIGSDNSFFGTLAGFTNTTGLRNSSFGSFAAGNFMVTSTASDNSFFGYQAGFNNTGASNTFFGSNTGNANTIGANNSFFGAGAGASNIAENNNTFIGASSNGMAGITNATAIGAKASVTQSNSLVLGSINGVNNATADTNVGIGTTAPEQRLSVGGAVNIDQGNQNNGTADFALSFGHASGEAIGSKRTAGGNQFGLDFYTLFTNRMSITQSGNVGIGTTSPVHRLSIIGGPAWTASTWAGSLELANASAIAWRSNNAGNRFGIGHTDGGLFFFATASDPGTTGSPSFNQLVINDSGNVGIGTIAPITTLDVRGGLTLDPGSSPVLYTSASSGEQNRYLQLLNSPSSPSASGLKAGGLLVADDYSFANPGKNTLIVKGTAQIGNIPLLPSAASVCFNAQGDLLQCGGSSLRWKTNVRPFLGGLEIIRRLRPINFNWKESGLPDIGLGAEDVAKVAPSLAFTNSKGEAEGVKYERLNLLLINAVKEQQSQIETLRTANAALNARLRAVERTLRKKAGSARRRR